MTDHMCADTGKFPPCWLKPGHTGAHANATGSFWDTSSNRVCICGAPLREGDWFRREVNKPDECSHATRNQAADVIERTLTSLYEIEGDELWDDLPRLAQNITTALAKEGIDA